MTRKWNNVGEWYEAKIRNNRIEEIDFLNWLLATGKIDDDMIQDHFQTKMSDDGFFDDWPDDAPITIDYELRTAKCKECGQAFDYDELEDLTEEDVYCEMDGYEEPDDPEDEDCPLKKWCRKRKDG